MKRLDLKVGFSCNNLCAFCVQGDKRHKFSDKTTKQLFDSLKEARKRGITSVVFTGGEPTIRPDLSLLVKSAKKMGFSQIQMQSNGRMFSYEKFCKDLIAAGVTEFSPALHGSSAKIHDGLVCAPGSYEQVVRGIKNLKRMNQYVLTNTVITSQNYKDIPKIAKLLVDLGVDQFQFAFVHVLGTADKNKKWLVPKKTEIMPFVKKGLDIGVKAGKTVMTEAIPYCFMNGYEDCVAEKGIPDTTVFDANFEISNYTDYRQNEGKSKSANCKKCRFFNICEGPWKEYVDLFGWGEFKPRLK